ncbi:MAG: phosphate ABC transporter substrate-binding protein [Burkholderiales bacterium]
MSKLTLRAMLGDYPNTMALKDGRVKSDLVELEFAKADVPHDLFKRVIAGEFDVAELAIMTYLQARGWNKPIAALPVAIGGRFQHAQLAYNTDFGTVTTKNIEGKRVGVRTYSQTTPAWVRGILQNDYGVDLSKIHWVTFEDGHVPEYKDPANSERAPHGETFMKMLLAGKIDAAVVMAPDLKLPNIKSVITDASKEIAAWYKTYNAIQLNHVMVVKESLLKTNPDAAREIFRMMKEAKAAANEPLGADGIDYRPIGYSNNKRNFEMAALYASQQKIIPRELKIDDLFNDVTRAMQ